LNQVRKFDPRSRKSIAIIGAQERASIRHGDSEALKPPKQKTAKEHSTRGIARIRDRIQVTYHPLSKLKLDADNPRTHSRKQVRQIARSIETFGFNVPVLIDAKGRVIAGHGRILACQLLGWSEVPTISLDHLSEAQAGAFMITDNRLSENSVWDDQLLAEQLQALSELELDFDLEVTGFDMAEIDLRIEGLGVDGDQGADSADELDAIPSGPPVSRPGDLLLLGRHRVYCGSALDQDSYGELMDEEHATMVLTDPPYNVAIEGNVSGLGAIHHREFAMASGEMNQGQFIAFLVQALSLLAGYSADGALHYIFMDWRHIGELLAAGRGIYSELKGLCIWVKNHTGMGALYRSRHELVFVFKHGRASHRNNIMLGTHGRDRTNVWMYPSPRTPSDEGNLLALHPTVKPVRLVADAILDCTARGDIVLDSFLGSGTTVIAAERTGRRCYGLELDPLYLDTIVRRWQAYTGEHARQAATGRTFNELEAERAEKKRDGE
jgi:DNA modification methylase